MEPDIITDEIEQKYLDRYIGYLNDMLGIDQVGVQDLMSCHVQTNEAMAHHTTVQCRYQMYSTAEENRLQFGVLGFINGFFGADHKDRGYIAAVYEGGRLVRFQRAQYDD